jgi:hypothetical protein
VDCGFDQNGLILFFIAIEYMFPYKFRSQCQILRCSPNKVDYVKLKTGGNEPRISTKMRYAQIANSATKEGRQTTMTGEVAQQRYPNAFFPRTNIIVPLTN